MYKLQRWLIPFFIVLIGAALFFGITGFLENQLMPSYAQQALQGRQALIGLLSSKTNSDLDELSILSSKTELRAILKTRNFKDAAQKFNSLVSAHHQKFSEKPSFVVLLDRKGQVVLESGKSPGFGKNWSGLPIFLETKSGVIRDGILTTLKKEKLRVLATPIYEGAEVYVLLLGWRFTNVFVDKLAKELAMPVALLGTNPAKAKIGAAFEGLEPEILNGIREERVDNEALDLIVPLPGFPMMMLESGRFLFAKEAPWGRKNAPEFVYAVDRISAFNLIANTQILIILSTFLMAFLMAFLLKIWEKRVETPLNRLTEQLSGMATGGKIILLSESSLSGPVKRLGRQLNLILQNPNVVKAGNVGQTSSQAQAPAFPLDASGAVAVKNSAFPLDLSTPNAVADTKNVVPKEFDAGDSVLADDAPSDGAPTGNDYNFQPLGEAPVSAEFKKSSLAGLFDAGGGPIVTKEPLLAAVKTTQEIVNEAVLKEAPIVEAHSQTLGGSLPGMASNVQERPTLVPTAVPTLSQISSEEMMLPEESMDERTVVFNVPNDLLREISDDISAPDATNMNALPNRFGSLEDEDDEQDERTVVAAIPADLLKETVRSVPMSVAPAVDPIEEHFRETFERFINLRIECGEDTSQLTYERFVAKLKKNREQIMEKYHPKSVRFQVYEKAGKAALRAVPVRD